MASRDRIVVSTLRCGRSNPGSNPGHGRDKTLARLGWSLFFWIVYGSVVFHTAKPSKWHFLNSPWKIPVLLLLFRFRLYILTVKCNMDNMSNGQFQSHYLLWLRSRLTLYQLLRYFVTLPHTLCLTHKIRGGSFGVRGACSLVLKKARRQCSETNSQSTETADRMCR